MMYRYYKITPKWAKRIGMLGKARMHPDGWYLVTPQAGDLIIGALAEEGLNLVRDEAFAYIGAIGLNVAEAIASQYGQLTHEIPEGEVLGDEPETITAEAEEEG